LIAVSETPTPRKRSRRIAFSLSLVLLLTMLALAWWHWHATIEQWLAPPPADDTAQRIAALEAQVQSQSNELRQMGDRIVANASAQRIIREDLLGIAERAALLEEAVNRLADPEIDSTQTLRLDEAELLLTMAIERLELANDRAAAERAYVLAQAIFAGVANPRFVSLRQTMAQELAALRTAPDDPRILALSALDTLEAALDRLGAEPVADRAGAVPQPRWRALLGQLVQVRRSDPQQLLASDERGLARTALNLELALARAALERRDETSFRGTLTRIIATLQRLYPESATRQAQISQLHALHDLQLRLDMPVLGSTLEQLRALRDSTVDGGSRP